MELPTPRNGEPVRRGLATAVHKGGYHAYSRLAVTQYGLEAHAALSFAKIAESTEPRITPKTIHSSHPMNPTGCRRPRCEGSMHSSTANIGNSKLTKTEHWT